MYSRCPRCGGRRDAACRLSFPAADLRAVRDAPQQRRALVVAVEVENLLGATDAERCPPADLGHELERIHSGTPADLPGDPHRILHARGAPIGPFRGVAKPKLRAPADN